MIDANEARTNTIAVMATVLLVETRLEYGVAGPFWARSDRARIAIEQAEQLYDQIYNYVEYGKQPDTMFMGQG